MFKASDFSCVEVISCEFTWRVPMPVASDLLCLTYLQNFFAGIAGYFISEKVLYIVVVLLSQLSLALF